VLLTVLDERAPIPLPPTEGLVKTWVCQRCHTYDGYLGILNRAT